jgi:hypothetical protein
VLGVTDGLSLANETDPERLLLVQALIVAADAAELKKQEQLATLIINKLSEAMR